MTLHRHMAEGRTETAIRCRFDEDKLDDQHLQTRLNQHYHCNHEFLPCWHLHFEQVLKDVYYLGHRSVKEEDPRQQRHIYTAQQDTDDIGRHWIPIQTDNSPRLRRDAQTPKYQSQQRREEKAQSIEDSNWFGEDLEVILEVTASIAEEQDVVHCPHCEDHRRVQPEGTIPASMGRYISYSCSSGVKNPPDQNFMLVAKRLPTSLLVTLKDPAREGHAQQLQHLSQQPGSFSGYLSLARKMDAREPPSPFYFYFSLKEYSAFSVSYGRILLG